MGRVSEAGLGQAVEIPEESFQALSKLKEGDEQEQDVLQRAVSWYYAYSLLTKSGTSPDLRLSLAECAKASIVLRQMAAAGYGEDTGLATCRALFGEQSDSDLREAFDAFDQAGSGSLDRAEFRRALPLMGENVDEEKINALFAAVDTDKSDNIEYNEFCTLVKGMNPKEGSSVFAALQNISLSAPRDLGAGIASRFSDLGSGMSHITSAYSAGLADLGTGEMRKAGVILDNFKEAGYSEEMAATVCRALLGEQTEPDMQEAYKFFDSDSNGWIDAQEMKRALPLMGEDVPQERIEELYVVVDKNKDGKVSFEEFSELVKKMNPKDAEGGGGGGSSWLQDSLSGGVSGAVSGVSGAVSGLSGWFTSSGTAADASTGETGGSTAAAAEGGEADAKRAPF